MSNQSKPRVALVTGAAQGIGRAIALRLADDGFDVAVNDISIEKLESLIVEIRSKGRQISSHIADVAVEEQVRDMIRGVVLAHGGLDIMVANAGIAKLQSLVDTTVEDWDKLFSVNARGTFLCYKHAGRQMIEQGRGGRIIGAASVAGKRGTSGLSAYSGTKFAIRGLTQAAGPHGITVNAYAPGAIETDLLNYLGTAKAKGTDSKLSDYLDTLAKRTPVGYNGTAVDVAGLVSYLASKESHFITGQSISCNGGTYFD